MCLAVCFSAAPSSICALLSRTVQHQNVCLTSDPGRSG